MTNICKILFPLIGVLALVIPVAADDLVLTGRYVRVTKSPQFTDGGRETGELLISSVAKGHAEFHLNVTWNPIIDDDGSRTHNGVIEEGVIKISKNKGRYASAYKEDKELGQCIIDFTFKGREVVLSQKGKCWWFGVNVDASGVYRMTAGNETIIIR